MSFQEPALSAILHRLEVHAGPHESAEPETVWSISVRTIDEEIALWAYLRRRETEGLGQAQAVGLLGEHVRATVESSSGDDHAEFLKWVEDYAAEVLWDTLRRAMQAQAALMDFQFDLDVKAPEASLKFDATQD